MSIAGLRGDPGRIRRAWKALEIPPGLIVPLLVVFVFVVAAAAAPWLAPHSPVSGQLGDRLKPPFGFEGGERAHLLGTDRQGVDVLSRMLYGARVSLSLSLACIAVTASIGSLLGIISGYLGGWIDAVVMRTADIQLSLPGILMAVLFAALFGPSFAIVVVITFLLLWPNYARVVRGETLQLRERDFVKLAKVAGLTGPQIMMRHLLPNLLPSILVLATLHVGFIIVLEASLSFLGVGIPPPAATWGGMVNDGRAVLETGWWISALPGLAILIVVLCFNMVGDWVRDRLDPKLRQV